MNYSSEIHGLMAEANKLHVVAEAHRKEHGSDREYRRMWIRQSQIQDRQCDLQRQAAKEFAALNGWRWVERHFLARTLARGGTHEGKHDGGGSWGSFGVRDETTRFHALLLFHAARGGARAIPARTDGKGGDTMTFDESTS